MLRRKKWAEDEFSKMVEEEDKFRSNQIEKLYQFRFLKILLRIGHPIGDWLTV